MPNTGLRCPFCPAKPSSPSYLNHLLSQHKTQLLSFGKNREKLVWVDKQNPGPFSFYLPNNQPNWCCLGCKTSCVKKPFADKHFPEHRAEHIANLKLLLKDCESLPVSEAPPPPPAPTGLSVKDKINIARSLRQVKNNITTMKSENATLKKKIARLLEARKISEDDLSDISDAEEEEYDIVEENEALFHQTLPWLEERHIINPRSLETQ